MRSELRFWSQHLSHKPLSQAPILLDARRRKMNPGLEPVSCLRIPSVLPINVARPQHAITTRDLDGLSMEYLSAFHSMRLLVLLYDYGPFISIIIGAEVE